MKVKKNIILFLFLFNYTVGFSQFNLSVYYSSGDKDTIADVVGILKEQLSKGKSLSFQEFDETKFTGKGILLSARPERWKKYAASIKKSGPEGVNIITTGSAVIIIGNSKLAVQHGVFLYLEKLGYRFYFPHPDWHIIPSKLDLYPKINYTGRPSFDHRRIWYGYGTGSKRSDADYNFWFKANRQGGALNASFGQAYDDIVYRNQEVFKKHPEWFYPQPAAGVLPDDPKFNIANEELVQFVIKDVLKRIEDSKKKGTQVHKMISMSPSDGLGICNTPACQKFGTLTDRVFYLVNRVAKAVRQKHPDTWIGAYAYSEFIAPPTIKLEPNVFVGVTTAFNYSKYPVDELVNLWSKKAGKTGIYDYFSNYAWDKDVAGQSLASRPAEVVRNVKKYYKMGAKGYEAESTTGWVSKGLGHYLGAQLMWNVHTNTDKLTEEFFTLSFGRAAGTIKKLWAAWENNRFSTPRESDLGKWIDWVYDAEKQESNKNVQARFFHLKSYLYYLALLRRNAETKSEGDLIALLNYGYRMMDYGSFAGYPSLFELGNLSSFAGMKFNDPAARWKSNRSVITSSEMDKLLVQEKSRLRKFNETKEFTAGNSFVKAPVADKWKGPAHLNQDNNMLWYPHDFIMQVVKQGKDNFIDFSGGYVTGGGGETPIRVSIVEYKGIHTTDEKKLLTYNYTGLKTTERISLAELKPGFYKVSVADPLKIFKIIFAPTLNYSILVTPDKKLNSNFCNNLFAFVPGDVKSFTVWKSIEVKFETPTGRIVDLANKKEEEAEVKVLAGEAGLWKIIFFSGSLYLGGLPPVLGFNPSNMLVPAGIK